MITLFGSLLFWIGASLVYIGPFVAPMTARTLVGAFVRLFACSFGGGVLFMGTAMVNLAYVPPPFMQSLLAVGIAWAGLLVGMIVALTKTRPSRPQQETNRHRE